MQSINFRHCVGRVNATFGSARLASMVAESAKGFIETEYFHMRGICVNYGPRCKFYEIYLGVMYGYHVHA
jgi:hypothetical protein